MFSKKLLLILFILIALLIGIIVLFIFKAIFGLWIVALIVAASTSLFVLIMGLLAIINIQVSIKYRHLFYQISRLLNSHQQRNKVKVVESTIVSPIVMEEQKFENTMYQDWQRDRIVEPTIASPHQEDQDFDI
ncbi:MAG: hypothetical protein WCD86_08900 [Ktedonobacteraceae bacterium]